MFSLKAKFVIVIINEDGQFINNIFVINMGYTIEDFATIVKVLLRIILFL